MRPRHTPPHPHTTRNAFRRVSPTLARPWAAARHGVGARSRIAAFALLAAVGSGVCGAVTAADAAIAGSPPSAPIKVPAGFDVDRLYTVPPEQGSWVAMCVEPKGRLIVSDQFGRLYWVTVPTVAGTPPAVRVVDADLGAAQGLLWAFDSLYAVVNRPADRGGSGLYRLRSTRGDDRFDDVRLLRALPGGGEHGPHAVVLGPDGRSLYLLAGNATDLPQPERSRVPRRWAMDMLLPPLGQSDGVFKTNRPGGWICRLDPDGRSFELVAMGLRNPYDIAFNADGELFTFDADMEWDLGTPWYRPTRVVHVTSGAEFGWRTGSAKWPDYYTDSQPAVLDVGESSPTGLAFGYGARFPAKYQRALFMGDWSYGKIYALHLEPRGATYAATLELFLSGSPLPVTDLVIHPGDGALYFLTGGRQTESGLFRVRYHGSEPTAGVVSVNPSGRAARRQRQRLERFHGRQDPAAVAAAWPALDSPDRATRAAARIALEHQPAGAWQERVLREPRPRAQLAALMALARCGDPSLRPAVFAALGRLRWASLAHADRLDLLRVYALACLRLGTPTEGESAAIAAQLGAAFPSGQYDLNRELSTLLVHVRAPGIVDRVLAALETAPSQEEQIHHALTLSTLDPNPWTFEQRRRYFAWFARAGAAGGGVTYGEYLGGIRSQALEQLDPTALTPLAPILNQKPPDDPYLELKQRRLVREWTVDDLLPAVTTGMDGRDFDRGRRMFSTAMCIKCHRFNRQGGMTGPDLTGVGSRFDARMLLESIVEPSKVVSDQYATVEITTVDGESYTGRIGDQTDKEVLVKADLLNPAKVRRLPRAAIQEIKPSTLSLMPTALLDSFERDEILDLIAYLRSRGDPSHPFFARPRRATSRRTRPTSRQACPPLPSRGSPARGRRDA